MSCRILSRQFVLSTAIWGKGFLLGHLILEYFNGKILNGLTLNFEQTFILLRKDALSPDE